MTHRKVVQMIQGVTYSRVRDASLDLMRIISVLWYITAPLLLDIHQESSKSTHLNQYEVLEIYHDSAIV